MINISIPNLSKREKKYLIECVSSNFVSAVGKYISIFENKFKKIVNTKFASSVNSGTSALHLSLLAAGVKKNDLIIVPTYTFAATINAILYTGAKPWFFDISEDDFVLNFDQVENVLKKKTIIRNKKIIHKKTKQTVSAIMPVFTYGLSPDLKKLNKINKKYNLKVILDAASGHGSTFNNELISKKNFLTCYSFNGNKSFTSGGGGMIVTNDKKIYKEVNLLKNVGKKSNKYLYQRVGFNYKINNIQAAVGVGQIENYKKILANKKKIFRIYEKKIPNKFKRFLFQPKKWQTGVPWVKFLLLNSEIVAKKLISFLNINSIESKIFWRPIHLDKPYKKFLTEDLSISEKIWKRVIILPSSSSLKKIEQKKVINVLKKFNI